MRRQDNGASGLQLQHLASPLSICSNSEIRAQGCVLVPLGLFLKQRRPPQARTYHMLWRASPHRATFAALSTALLMPWLRLAVPPYPW